MKLTNIGTVRGLMEKHGIKFQKKFGQNFLINEEIPMRIADECGAGEDDCILEIGPGIGTLTRELCSVAGKVVAVEIDSGLIPILEETLADFDNVEVINSDIMKIDIDALYEEKFKGKNVYVCANLPYYITTPILMLLLESRLPFKKMTFMVQKEVADRLSSNSKEGDYGAVTASVSYYGKVEKLFNVSAGNFMPAPKVDSAVIQITLYDEPPVKVNDEKLFFKVIKAAFEQRRKTLVNALSGKMDISKEYITAAVVEAGLDPNIRGERLDIAEFAILSDIIKRKQTEK
ncbi:MAG: 16S rRNA (adenine(1518)-N(6)/adenine(1519)-N(6))-dimethyltransferase RsmA [Clostridia bacterium]|nr:16S rRNA (adenine(1518)-N(6)/adenine(1519)-N(6))-dimethyltransferase RsmA [Clostridia bacterium]